jgi:hypothetical protein
VHAPDSERGRLIFGCQSRIPFELSGNAIFAAVSTLKMPTASRARSKPVAR